MGIVDLLNKINYGTKAYQNLNYEYYNSSIKAQTHNESIHYSTKKKDQDKLYSFSYMNNYEPNTFYLYHSLSWLLEDYSNGFSISNQDASLQQFIERKWISKNNCLIALHWFELHHAQIVNYSDVLNKSIKEIVKESIELGKVPEKEFSAFMIRRSLEIDRLSNQV